jgi:hypothetical protein
MIFREDTDVTLDHRSTLIGTFVIIVVPSGSVREPLARTSVPTCRLIETTSNSTRVGASCASRAAEATVRSTGATTARIFNIDVSAKTSV